MLKGLCSGFTFCTYKVDFRYQLTQYLSTQEVIITSSGMINHRLNLIKSQQLYNIVREMAQLGKKTRNFGIITSWRSIFTTDQHENNFNVYNFISN